MSFKDQLAAFGAGTMVKVHAVTREAVMEAGERLIERSPIGAPETWKKKPPPGYEPGRFKSNWNYGLMSPDSRTTALTDIRTLNNIEELPTEAGGLVHYLTNAMPYGPALERGHSNQAPQGMVGLTVLEWNQIVEAAARRVSA